MATKTLDKDQILEAIDSMSVLELSELVKAFEERYGVTAAAPVAVAAAGAPAATRMPTRPWTWKFSHSCASAIAVSRPGPHVSLSAPGPPTTRPKVALPVQL